MATATAHDPTIIEFDVRTDEMLVNMGPQHPSTHGVLRLVLRTDGEVISEVTPHLGYLHRCAEKIGENVTPIQFIPYTDRMDYLAAMNMNLGFSLAIEKLCDQYHVAVYWSGHDHIYERSHQVFGGQVADMTDALTLSKGTVYVVSGGGGAPLYGVAKITTTYTQQSTYNYVDVQADPSKLTIKAYKLDGSQLDAYTISQ